MVENQMSGKQKTVHVKLKLIVSAIILLVLALGFGALLTMTSLEKVYVGSIVSEYQVVGRDLQRNLEQALRFGKNINKFVGMNRLLEETKTNLISKVDIGQTGASAMEPAASDRVNVSVALPDGKILYSADQKLVGLTLPAKISALGEPSTKSEPPYIKFKGNYYVALPVHGRDKNQIASPSGLRG